MGFITKIANKLDVGGLSKKMDVAANAIPAIAKAKDMLGIGDGSTLGSATDPLAGVSDVPAAPTVANSSSALDTAAQTFAASMQGGATSTIINGSQGVDDTKKTSRIVLGQ